MDMLLMGLCVSFVGVAVTAAAFVAATRPKALTLEAQPELRPVKALTPARFFSDRTAPSVPLQPAGAN